MAWKQIKKTVSHWSLNLAQDVEAGDLTSMEVYDPDETGFSPHHQHFTEEFLIYSVPPSPSLLRTPENTQHSFSPQSISSSVFVIGDRGHCGVDINRNLAYIPKKSPPPPPNQRIHQESPETKSRNVARGSPNPARKAKFYLDATREMRWAMKPKFKGRLFLKTAVRSILPTKREREKDGGEVNPSSDSPGNAQSPDPAEEESQKRKSRRKSLSAFTRNTFSRKEQKVPSQPGRIVEVRNITSAKEVKHMEEKAKAHNFQKHTEPARALAR